MNFEIAFLVYAVTSLLYWAGWYYGENFLGPLGLITIVGGLLAMGGMGLAIVVWFIRDMLAGRV